MACHDHKYDEIITTTGAIRIWIVYGLLIDVAKDKYSAYSLHPNNIYSLRA